MIHVGYYNGRIEPLETLMIPAGDRAVYFGDGVYEALLFRGRILFGFEEHLDRFENSCRMLRLALPMSRDQLKAELMKCIDATDSPDGMLYWQLSRGTEMRHHDFPEPDVRPNLLAYTKPMAMPTFAKKRRLKTVEDTRYLHCNIKTLNLIPSVMAAQAAKEAGCDEAVFHRGETVTECSHSNILIFKNGVLRTHPADNLILPGITRMHLLALARDLGIPVEETAFTLADLREADDVLVTSSTVLFSTAEEIDGVPVGGCARELCDRLRSAYMEKFNTCTSSK